MLGAIAGDIIGSPYEHYPIKTVDFPLLSPASRFTDDTVLTIATAAALLGDGDFARAYEAWYYRYPDLPYGGGFHSWARSREQHPYGSWGNGAAMRVSPVAWLGADLENVIALAAASAAVTHDHPEGIRGAQAVAGAIYLARQGAGKSAIRALAETRFGYDLSRSVDAIRPDYVCDLSCQSTVPPAIACFLESTDFESAIRLAVSLGSDADTMACITGSIAEAHYGGIPSAIRSVILPRLDAPILDVLQQLECHLAHQVPRMDAN